ncbi:hypothetical protein QC763_610080 [Podospora pseudopauciseta]|uniref:Uncharacterized protein n=2 Tax=Podospora TaxID=5144 RepID=A0ABR0H6H0_9PEZI|nr:hypothetical protein QC763_610080 [Podospora pseudopauciseta]KAK4671941.1 hypothetical protein QC764_610080 [Podospora pseudoanserina]
MYSLFTTLTVLAAILSFSTSQAQITAAPSIPTVSGCPAVLSITDICSTCMTLACITTAEVTVGCSGCPEIPATVFSGYPCEGGCDQLGGCKTLYQVVTAQADQCESGPLVPLPSITDGGESAITGGEDATTGDASGTQTVTETGDGVGPTGTPTTTGTVTISTSGGRRLSPFRLW